MKELLLTQEIEFIVQQVAGGEPPRIYLRRDCLSHHVDGDERDRGALDIVL
jgi:hypothetical protein